VDGEEVLNKLRQFNLQSWNYKDQDPATSRHYGPTAQEFFSAFGHDGIGTVGTDTTLCGSDVTGINMIAIQALEKRTAELKEKTEQLVKLSAKIEILEKIVETQHSELKILKDKLVEFGNLKSVLAKLESSSQ